MPVHRRPITADDLLRLRVLSDPQLSPDGTRVAYVLTEVAGDQDGYRSAIWVATVDGGACAPFTRGARREKLPRWSPDGAWLAFLSDRADARPQLFIMPAHGGEAWRVTQMPGGVADLAWAPDSRRIAVVSRTGVPDDPGKPPLVRHITRIKHRYDGEGYFDGARKHLFVVDREGGVVIQITEGDWDDQQPAWSPEGDWIAFSSNRSPGRDVSNVSDIWIVPAFGGEARQVTPGHGPATAPAWSPDGRHIAYVGQARPDDYAANWGIWLTPAQGGEPTCLTADLDRSVGSDLLTDTRDHAPSPVPVWTPDGQGVYFLASDFGDAHLFRVDLGGPLITRLLAGPRQIMSFSISADGLSIALDYSTPTNPGDVYLAAADGLSERRLTAANAALLDEMVLTQPEPFRFTSSDGEDLDGWLMRPTDFQAGRYYPLVLQVHGGPHALYGNTFMHEFQLLAAAGYVVVYTNPRGSRGYGERFAGAVRGAWGGQDYEDVLAALDWAERKDYVDSARAAICGGSYGGYMANWVIGHTDRFTAAITERSVANLFSMYGSTDIQGFVEYEFMGPWWEQVERYRQLSPLNYVEKIRTPLLIIHSEQDSRCPIEQAEQLFVALKRLSRDVELLRFPEENHNLSRSGRPDRRLERLNRILEWLQRHLGQDAVPVD